MLCSRSAHVLLGLLLTLIPVSLMADEADSTATITGSVFTKFRLNYDYWHKEPLPDAFVSVRVGKDSVVTSTDKLGRFKIEGMKAGPVHIWSSKLGFEAYSGTLDASTGINMILIELKEKRIQLAAAKVTAEAKPVTTKGDTLIFNAGAVSTSQEENALEILAQMPGVTLDEGRILVNGEPVKRTYVNGKLLFGDNTMTPLVSILASDVVNIKTYEEESIESRRYGLVNDKKDRVMDITTKDPIVTAFDGHAMASGGADLSKDIDGEIKARYGTGIVGNFFSERFLAFLTAHSNNLGKTTFRQDEYLKSEGAMQRDEKNSGISAGVEKYWGDRLLGNNIKLSYGFYKTDTKNGRRSKSDYFGEDGSVFRTDTDTTANRSLIGVHDFSAHSTFYTDKAGLFNVNGRMRVTDNNLSSLSSQRVYSASGGHLFMSPRQISANNDFYLSSFILWSGDKSQSGWIPEAKLSYDYNNSKGTEVQLDTMTVSDLFRHITAGTAGKSSFVGGTASLKKIIENSSSRTSSLAGGIDASFNESSNFRNSLSISRDGMASVNTDNSFDYCLRFFQMGVPLRYSRAWNDVNFALTMVPSVSLQEENDVIPSVRKASKTYFTPSATAAFKAGSIMLTLATAWRAPSANQFRDWIDDRNEYLLTGGNPSLVVQKNYTMFGQYVLPKIGKYGSAYIHGTINFIKDPIVSKIESFSEDTPLAGGYVAKAGTMLSTYENADYSFSGSIYTTWTQRFQRIKTSLSVNSIITASRDMAFVGATPVIMHGFSPFLGISANIRPNKALSLHVGSRISYDILRNSSTLPATDRINAASSCSLKYNFLKTSFVNISYWRNSFYFFSSTGEDYSNNVLDVILGTRLMSGRLGLSISFNDILSDGNSYKINVAPNSRVQVWTPSYGRYILFNVSFRLNKKNPGTEYQGSLQKGGEFIPGNVREAMR